MNLMFDPLGFVTPVIVEAKLIYRSLCQKDLDWHEPLPQVNVIRWEKWMESLFHLKTVSIPRWFGLLPLDCGQTYRLHYFVDASKEAYGAVCCLRTVDKNGAIKCSLVVSKSRLSSQDETSIPRLELLAAVLAVNIDCTLRKELKIPSKPSMFWSDSLIVLQSLANERKRFPLFVSRRLLLITKHSCIDNWSHVPTKLNPADILSGGSRAVVLAKIHKWFEGPQFLNNNPSCWPVCCKKCELSADEVKCFDKKHVNASLAKINF